MNRVYPELPLLYSFVIGECMGGMPRAELDQAWKRLWKRDVCIRQDVQIQNIC